jgi:hypothetical protein
MSFVASLAKRISIPRGVAKDQTGIVTCETSDGVASVQRIVAPEDGHADALATAIAAGMRAQGWTPRKAGTGYLYSRIEQGATYWAVIQVDGEADSRRLGIVINDGSLPY